MTSYGRVYFDQLGGSPALDFLVSRGLDRNTVIGWQLGYVGKPATEAHRRFQGWLSIPYWDGRGRETKVRFRRLDGGSPKYLSTRHDTVNLFGIRYVDYPRVFVCEGEVDTMTAWQLGFKAVGIPGTQTWRSHWKYLFRSCEEVVVAFDPDDAGQLAAAKIFRDLQRITTVRQAVLPKGHDVNDLLQEWGPSRLKGFLDG